VEFETMIDARKINGVLRKIPSWPLYFIAPIPALVFFYWAVTNQLGADPLAELERQLGRWALQLLLATLLVTPIRKLTGVSFLKFRRALGLAAFMYICFHLLTWFVLDKQFFWGEILKDLYKRPYIILGMTGFVILTPLALTSNMVSIRRMGPQRWNLLHKLSYLAVLLGAFHFLLVRKVIELEPGLYVLGAILLVSWRLPWKRFLRFGGVVKQS
jgi:methionine sulfoxide reductase heme-binding subunit